MGKPSSVVTEDRVRGVNDSSLPDANNSMLSLTGVSIIAISVVPIAPSTTDALQPNNAPILYS